MAYEVVLAARAQRDLRDIKHYIAQDNPLAAVRFCDELLDTAESLALFPLRGKKVDDANTHFLIHGNYRIYYKITESRRTVHILRFWHGAQDKSRLRLRESSPPFPVLHSV